MELLPIETLSGLRAALTAPADTRLDHFRAAVMEPLRPFWGPFLTMPWAAQAEPKDDPALAAARVFHYYSPEQDPAAGIAALDRLEGAGTWDACLTAMRAGWDALAPEEHGIALAQILHLAGQFGIELLAAAEHHLHAGLALVGGGGEFQRGRETVAVQAARFQLEARRRRRH